MKVLSHILYPIVNLNLYYMDSNVKFYSRLSVLPFQMKKKKRFCCPSEIFKKISRPINICFDDFEAHAKTLRPSLQYT